MKITGTINFELDDKDLKRSTDEHEGSRPSDIVVIGQPGIDDVARARIQKEHQKLHAVGIRQRIKKLEEYMGIGNTVFEVLMQAGHGKLAELKAHLAEVEKSTDPKGQAG